MLDNTTSIRTFYKVYTNVCPIVQISVNDTIVFLAGLPGRTLIRDMDIWGTNPFAG